MAKSSKSQKSERQKRIDEALSQQRGAEKRRGNIIVVSAVVIALLVVGAAAYSPIKGRFEQAKFDKLDLDSIGAPADVCQAVKTEDASASSTGAAKHVPEGTTVDYVDAPPAFGPHWNVAGIAPVPFSDKYYDKNDVPELEQLVHNLEHGYTIMWYDDTVAGNATELAQIVSIAKKFKGDAADANFRLKFIAVPWTGDDEKRIEAADPTNTGMRFPAGQHVAFTHWANVPGATADPTTQVVPSQGVWQYCSAPSGAALKTFMTNYPYTDAPEAGAI